jgi:hypothetical protein
MDLIKEYTLQALHFLRIAAQYPDHFRMKLKNSQLVNGMLEARVF